MRKLLFLLLIVFMGTNVYAKDIYVDPDSEAGEFLKSLDLVGARNGDTPSMVRIAKDCFLKDDMACAYQWSSMALRGRYVYQIQEDEKFKKVQELSKEHLTAEQIKTIDEENEKMIQKWQGR